MPNRTEIGDDSERWAAVLARDSRADGRFFYGVLTTGIFCRPSCPARRPKRGNVAFFETRAAAQAAGLRPCKRCRPDRVSAHRNGAEAITDACRLMEQADARPPLAELAATAGLSPSHFHRAFKAATGVTPKAYADAHRRRRLRRVLKEAATVTEAIYDAGFSSSGRFYASADASLGMTPTEFRSGGKGTTLRFAVGATSLGALLVAASDKGIAAILLGDEPEPLIRDLETMFPRSELVGSDGDFEQLVARVAALVEAPGRAHDLPLDIQGTAFQQRVWLALRKIPSGGTLTYAELANRIGAPSAVRAVAGACAANKLAVAIPCHRVVRTGGALSGYRWGVERKRELLQRERRPAARDAEPAPTTHTPSSRRRAGTK